jgi:amino acid transporter
VGGGIVAAIVMVSCFGTLNGSMLTNPRIFFAMADRGLFFKGIARVSPRFQTPSAAIWLAAFLGCAYVLFNDFQQLADRFVLGIWPFYIMAILGVFILRKKRPDVPRPYRTIGYPLVPLVFLLAATGMVINALVTDPLNTGVTFVIIAVGLPIYYLTIGRKSTSP